MASDKNIEQLNGVFSKSFEKLLIETPEVLMTPLFKGFNLFYISSIVLGVVFFVIIIFCVAVPSSVL